MYSINYVMLEADSDHIPSFLNARYDEVRFIAGGGYGKVYRCVKGGRTTAVKVLYEFS